MGVIWDIIKDIPQAAVLKERVTDFERKLAEAETQVDLLNIKLRQAESQIDQLTAENKRLTEQIASAESAEPALHENAISILSAFRGHAEPIPDGYILAVTQLGGTEFTYYLKDLEEQGYLRLSHFDDEGSHYALEQKGRKYLMDHPANSN